MADNLGGREEFEKSCDETAEVNFKSPDEIEEDIISISTVTWDPFTVLPKEIYMEIFKKLENPTDKQNFMNAHSKWYDLFKRERVCFLFGKVIDDLPLEDELTEGTDRSLTRLRLVCQEWNRGIQNYYQLHPDHFEFVFCEDEWKNNRNHLKRQYSNGYLIEKRGRRDQARPIRARQLQTDLTAFKASHPPSKNPILTRKISIIIYGEDVGLSQLGLYWSRDIDNLIDTYGRHIWHFSIQFGSKFTPGMYIRIIQWLEQMPELKTLQISFHYLIAMTKYDASYFNDIKMQPPEMGKLQNVHVSNFPTYAFNKLIEGIKALDKLEVDIRTCEPSGYLRLKGYQLPRNLTDAALTLTGMEDFRHLSKIGQTPGLRKLIINLESVFLENCLLVANGTWPEWKTLWTTIEEKFPAVQDLSLNLPGAKKANKKKALEQSLDCRLNATTLKRLSVSFSNLFSLDFLQDMKGLQELNIQLDMDHYRDKFKGSDNLIRRERINFNNRGFDTLWESNIWEVLPNLKKLLIHAKTGLNEVQGTFEGYSYEKKGQERVYKKS